MFSYQIGFARKGIRVNVRGVLRFQHYVKWVWPVKGMVCQIAALTFVQQQQ
jgi:hypothetical protein